MDQVGWSEAKLTKFTGISDKKGFFAQESWWVTLRSTHPTQLYNNEG